MRGLVLRRSVSVGWQARVDRSEDERRPAQRAGDQSESEGSRAVSQPNASVTMPGPARAVDWTRSVSLPSPAFWCPHGPARFFGAGPGAKAFEAQRSKSAARFFVIGGSFMYQALYRKWRSKTFGQVVGQDHVTQTLRRDRKSVV